MAIAGSGLYVTTISNTLGATQLALDLSLATHKGALFNNTITPNYNTDTAYGVAPYNANEVTGTNWAAGGVALTGPTLSIGAGGILTYDAADVSVASTTITNARGYLLYASALAGKNAILLVDFLADYSTVNGTFSIVWNASGIFTLDLVP